MNCANLVSNGPIFAVAGRIFPFPARNRRARAPDAAGALPAEARQAVDIPAAALNSAPGAPPRYPEAAMSRFVPQPNSAATSPSSGPVRIDKGAATARSRSGPAGHKKRENPLAGILPRSAWLRRLFDFDATRCRSLLLDLLLGNVDGHHSVLDLGRNLLGLDVVRQQQALLEAVLRFSSHSLSKKSLKILGNQF